MSARGDILDAVVGAIETTGNTLFPQIRASFARVKAQSDLPAVLVRVEGEQTVEAQSAQGWAIRELVVSVQVTAKLVDELAHAMEEYAEAIEQAVLYSEDLRGLVMDVRPAGYVAPEVDLDAERPVAVSEVQFRVTYEHWPTDPSVSPIGDPTF